ncbi:MAG: nucleotidyltransferase [Clostridiales bacterium]|nr:nucleotidyltransferase [Clostridiales bacterium]
MKILGLITEYNPFHNGHLYHLNKSKEITKATHTIAVMSGNFLQRGEPALVHKWARAQMAVKSGVDLVIELPTAFACATAEIFAFGAISLLDKLNIVDYISFGSEYGQLDLLELIAETLLESPNDFKNSLKKYLDEGLSFPKARSKALIEYLKNTNYIDGNSLYIISEIMDNPNNILAIEYIKSLKKLNSSIKPYTISRIKAEYHSKEINSNICSATAIREGLKKNLNLNAFYDVIPHFTYEILENLFENNIGPIFSKDFEQIIISLIRSMEAKELKMFFDVDGGLENRILNCSLQSNNLFELYNCIKSKRHPHTRIQRICMHILLKLYKKDILEFINWGGPQYVRVLAFNDKGREILKLCKDKSKLPIINKLANYIPENDISKKMLTLDIKATNIYALAIKNNYYSTRALDFYISPYYEKDRFNPRNI